MTGALLEVSPNKREEAGMKSAVLIVALVAGGRERIQVQARRALDAGASDTVIKLDGPFFQNVKLLL